MLLLLTAAWLASLVVSSGATTPLRDAHAAIRAHSSDSLSVHFTLTAPAIQQQHALLTWMDADHQRHSLPLLLRADRQPQHILIPVGVNPGWRGTVRAVRLVVPYPDTITLDIAAMRVVQRPLWALDQGVLHALAPLLPSRVPLPSTASVVTLTATLLAVPLALLLPWSTWRRRLGMAGVVLACCMAGWTVLQQATLLRILVPVYAPLPIQQAQSVTPSFDADPRAIGQLVAIADTLPAGPILLLDVAGGGDVRDRARFLFYPRRVDVRSPQDRPTDLPQLLATRYVAAIETNPTGQPPAPDWERHATPDGPLVIWQRPDLSPALTRPQAHGAGAVLALLAGLLLVGGSGWSVAGLLGWRGGLRLAGAWPLGTTLLAWWMALLALLGIGWSWGSMGLPLGLGTFGAWWWTRAAPSDRQHGWRARLVLHPHWCWLGVGLLALLVGAVTVQALLIPFSDRDTWRMWGLKGQAFFLDGALTPVLTTYRTAAVQHASYPPAQPLTQTWGYLAMGGLNERLVKLIFPLWYAAGVGLLGVAVRRWSSPAHALGWALLLATTPLVLDHATLGNADLPLAVALLLGGVLLSAWLEHGDRRWLLGGALVLGGAAWIKLDGSYLGILFLLSALGIRLWIDRAIPRLRGGIVRDGAAALLLFGGLVLPWILVTRVLNLNDVPDLATTAAERWSLLGDGARVLITEVLVSNTNSSLGLLGGGYGMLWFVCAGALVIGWRRVPRDPVLWFLLFAVGGGFLFYWLIYAVQPYASVERYLLHLAPLAILAAARATADGLPTLPLIPPTSETRPAAHPVPTRRPAPRTRRGTARTPRGRRA